MATTKIQPWKLPGAIGWEGFIPDEMERSVERTPRIPDTIAGVMSATGKLNFAVHEIPGVFGAISEVFTDYLFQGEKPPPPPNPEAEEQKAQAAFSREQFQRQTAASQNVKAVEAEILQETAQRISGGQMSATEVVQEVGAKEVGVNHVVFLWNQRLQKMEEAKNQQEQQKTASAAPSLVNSLIAQEGQSLVSSSGAIAGAG